jgi:hypothetical protein
LNNFFDVDVDVDVDGDGDVVLLYVHIIEKFIFLFEKELKNVMLNAIEKKDITTLWKLYPSIVKDKNVDPRVLKDVKYSLW